MSLCSPKCCPASLGTSSWELVGLVGSPKVEPDILEPAAMPGSIMHTHSNSLTLTEGELHTSPQQQLPQLWAPNNKNILQFLYFIAKNLLINTSVTPVCSSSPSMLHSPKRSAGFNLTTLREKTQASSAHFNYVFSCSWTAFHEAFPILCYPELLHACTLMEDSLHTGVFMPTWITSAISPKQD